jgi:hypothetical protein
MCVLHLSIVHENAQRAEKKATLVSLGWSSCRRHVSGAIAAIKIITPGNHRRNAFQVLLAGSVSFGSNEI